GHRVPDRSRPGRAGRSQCVLAAADRRPRRPVYRADRARPAVPLLVFPGRHRNLDPAADGGVGGRQDPGSRPRQRPDPIGDPPRRRRRADDGRDQRLAGPQPGPGVADRPRRRRGRSYRQGHHPAADHRRHGRDGQSAGQPGRGRHRRGHRRRRARAAARGAGPAARLRRVPGLVHPPGASTVRLGPAPGAGASRSRVALL
ncbi:MAG: hypothetical protein AVDCRST_MAG73-3413, partial [uncultured Thermomicrobiales bacterium]